MQIGVGVAAGILFLLLAVSVVVYLKICRRHPGPKLIGFVQFPVQPASPPLSSYLNSQQQPPRSPPLSSYLNSQQQQVQLLSVFIVQWFQSLLRCKIELLNFSMGFNIIAPYMEMLHINRSLHHRVLIYLVLGCQLVNPFNTKLHPLTLKLPCGVHWTPQNIPTAVKVKRKMTWQRYCLG